MNTIDPVADEPEDWFRYRLDLLERTRPIVSTWNTDLAIEVLVASLLADPQRSLEDLASDLERAGCEEPAAALHDVRNHPDVRAGEWLLATAWADVVAARPDAAIWRTASDLLRNFDIGYTVFRDRLLPRLERDAGVRERFLDMVDGMIDEVAADPSVGVAIFSERDNFRRLTERWRAPSDPTRPWHQRPCLEHLFSGNLHGDELYRGIGHGALAFALHLDHSRLLAALSRLPIPHPVQSAFTRSIMERDPETLCRLLREAPRAIEADERWNRSFVAPLLLASAVALLRQRGEAWSRAARRREEQGAPADDLPDRAVYVKAPVASIVRTLLDRPDGIALAFRWSIYLAGEVQSRFDQFGRTAVFEGSYGREEMRLLDALGAQIEPDHWRELSLDDLPADLRVLAECVRALPFIHREDASLAGGTLEPFVVSPETYRTDAGLQEGLRRLLPFEASPQRWLAELLGWRLLNEDDPVRRLDEAWLRLAAIRRLNRSVRIVERSRHDEPDWSLPSKAIFSIGLGALDRTARLLTSPGIEHALWNALYAMAWESWTVDDSVFDPFWDRAFLEVALRRVRVATRTGLPPLSAVSPAEFGEAIAPFVGSNRAFASLAIEMASDENERVLLHEALVVAGYSPDGVISDLVVLQDLDGRFLKLPHGRDKTLRELAEHWGAR